MRLGNCLRNSEAQWQRSWLSETAGCLLEPKASKIKVLLSRYVPLTTHFEFKGGCHLLCVPADSLPTDTEEIISILSIDKDNVKLFTNAMQ